MSEAGLCCVFRALDHTNAEKCLNPSATRAVQPGSLPQVMSRHNRIDLVALPPCDLIAVAVERPMMAPAQRDGVLIADLTPQRSRLGKPQMVGIGRPPPADQARLRRHESEVVTVAVAAWFVKCERRFVDMPCHRVVDAPW